MEGQLVFKWNRFYQTVASLDDQLGESGAFEEGSWACRPLCQGGRSCCGLPWVCRLEGSY